jgi:predicted nucleic acid-binding protein
MLKWMARTSRAADCKFLTCAITEIGLLRTLVPARAYSFTIQQGKDVLAQLKSTNGYDFEFLLDDIGIEHLPVWVRGGKQITDGHLLGLAKAHGATLATLDEGIRGAYLIPKN